MNLRVEFIGEKIIIYIEKKTVEYQLGSITCMISAGEWDELLQFLDVQKDYIHCSDKIFEKKYLIFERTCAKISRSEIKVSPLRGNT